MTMIAQHQSKWNGYPLKSWIVLEDFLVRFCEAAIYHMMFSRSFRKTVFFARFVLNFSRQAFFSRFFQDLSRQTFFARFFQDLSKQPFKTTLFPQDLSKILQDKHFSQDFCARSCKTITRSRLGPYMHGFGQNSQTCIFNRDLIFLSYEIIFSREFLFD